MPSAPPSRKAASDRSCSSPVTPRSCSTSPNWRRQWGLEVGVYKRTFEQPSPQPGVHWSKDVRFDKIAEGFGCHGEYVEKEDDMGPAIEWAYASGKTAVVHVCIDPKANSEEMPKYDEFRTWYAEGTQ